MANLLIILLLLVGASFRAIAQGDSSFVARAHQSVVEQYDTHLMKLSPLYNGSEYRPPLQTNDSHPFYNSFDWQPAKIVYNGLVFSNVDVLCDLHGDKLVIEHFRGEMMWLISQKLTEFTINGKRFLNFPPDILPTSLPESGFYEVLHDGTTQCLIRRKKNRQRKIESHGVELYYKEKVSYFVRKDQTYYPVNSKNSLLRLLDGKRNELNQYIRKQNISFRNDRANAIAKVLERYEEPNN